MTHQTTLQSEGHFCTGWPGQKITVPCHKNWLGWQDSNLRYAVPKTVALPLGYTPTVRAYLRRSVGGIKTRNSKIFLLF